MTAYHTFHAGSLPEEMTLLMRVLNSGTAPTAMRVNELTDWNRLIQFIQHHRVYPTAYQSMKNGTVIGLPDEWQQELQREYRGNLFEMLRLSAEMNRIHSQFNTSGIKTLFLKGPILALDLYGDISLRSSCDIDLLVPFDDLDLAEDLLLQDGYQKDEYISMRLNDWKWRHHHFTYIHPEKGMKVEVHWRLHPGPSIEPSFEELWERRRDKLGSGLQVNYLGSEDLFLFLVAHGARHGWSRVRWLLDIKLMLQKPMNLNLLLQLMKTCEAEHLVGQALNLCEQHLGAEIPDVLSHLGKGRRAKLLANKTGFYLERLINLHDEELPDEVSRFHKRYVYDLMGPRQKLLYLISLLYPYPVDCETLPLPKALTFLYFPLRPFLVLYRAVIGERDSRRT